MVAALCLGLSVKYAPPHLELAPQPLPPQHSIAALQLPKPCLTTQQVANWVALRDHPDVLATNRLVPLLGVYHVSF